jgi:hypothetical protein
MDLGLKGDAQGAFYRREQCNLVGTFFVNEYKDRPWGLLSVPNAMVRGIFKAMNEPGAEMPTDSTTGELNAHISVMRPEEIEMIGGANVLKNDRGKQFRYTLQRLESLVPVGWEEMSRAWMMRVHSPELQKLRKSYGLTNKPKDNKFDFHITVAVRRKGVLNPNDVAKAGG